MRLIRARVLYVVCRMSFALPCVGLEPMVWPHVLKNPCKSTRIFIKKEEIYNVE